MIALYIACGIAGALLLLLAVLICRALAFKPKKEGVRTPEKLTVDREKAVSDLAAMIRCKTVSDTDTQKEDAAEFEKFHRLLPTLFPATFAACEQIDVGERAVFLHLCGKSAEEPLVLMAHYDVVSVVEENWSRPAFAGVLEDGFLWGRGTLDTKGTLNGILQAAEQLLQSGYTPKRDVFFAFSGNEEIAGGGAPAIVDWFEKKGIRPGLVLDEGGAVVENVFPGVKSPCAVVGIAEKGMLNLEFSVKSNGGHASAPPPHTPVGVLARACAKVENTPFPFRLSGPAREMFDTFGRHSTFLYRLIFANLWFFRPVLNTICKRSGGELNALVRTTVAFTQMQGSKGMNVIPPHATMLANLRLMQGETVDDAIEYIRKTIGDDQIELRAVYGMNPSRISRTEGAGWENLKRAIADTWQGAIVSPYLMLACSDSRHYGRISDKVYRFSAMALSKEERATIHGNDEKIPVETIEKTVEFYLRILQNA
ncbi:MAG: M20/M25/M40 family metallo-hydrolase [Ruminococcaceae bacterium]|nr:M20/M25/M40 family metallo-hydrolase [Oscillospiraceae bacterium]